MSERSCELMVSYLWSKFYGKNPIATVGLYERTDSGDQLLSSESIEGQVGRTGSISFFVSMIPDVNPAGRTLVAIGSLTDSRTSLEVAGSSAESTPIVSTCG